MRERAKLAGGQLSIWSELNSGTEIEITIPAAVAHSKSSTTHQSMVSGKGT
jgi:signal transduction histidine kinase